MRLTTGKSLVRAASIFCTKLLLQLADSRESTVHKNGHKDFSLTHSATPTEPTFSALNLIEPLQRALAAEAYQTPTPIQAQAIPQLLAGHDLMGCAQTGTGKTAAFAIPLLQRLAENKQARRPKAPRALILAPTRELASQIGESIRTYGRFLQLKHTVIFGGVRQGPQVRAMQSGVDILVATPGRLLDLMNQGFIALNQVEILILDEADQMLDMGFINDLRKIVSHVPRDRQTLLFSATMPSEIRQLASAWLRNPVTINVVPPGTTADRVEQSVYFVEKRLKSKLLIHYLQEQGTFRTLVFTRTKHGADKLVRRLTKAGIRTEAIHGNKSQNARTRAITAFKSKNRQSLWRRTLRRAGLDIDNVTHVVNYDLPMTPDIYVHRIGRTARAGAEGAAVTFCDRDERSMLREIQKLIRREIPLVKLDPALFGAGATDSANDSHDDEERPSNQGRHNNRRGSSQGQGQGQGQGHRGGGRGRPQRDNDRPRGERSAPGEHAPRAERAASHDRPAAHAPRERVVKKDHDSFFGAGLDSNPAPRKPEHQAQPQPARQTENRGKSAPHKAKKHKFRPQGSGQQAGGNFGGQKSFGGFGAKKKRLKGSTGGNDRDVFDKTRGPRSGQPKPKQRLSHA